MNRQTLTQIKSISNLLTDPSRAERVMCTRLMSCLCLCQKTLTRDLINTLYKHDTSTREVDSSVRLLCRNNRDRERKLRRFIMRDKLQDTREEVKRARKKYQADTKNFKKEIGQHRAANEAFRVLMKRDTEKTWKEGVRKNQNKIKTLIERRNQSYDNQNNCNIEDSRSIKYKDRDLDQLQSSSNRESIEMYGGAEISDNMKKILSKEPGYMIHANIDEVEIEVEIEKGMAKARYELMNRGEEDDGDEAEGNMDRDGDEGRQWTPRREPQPNKVLQYSNMRATDIPTVQRLYEPKQGTTRQEIVMENTKEKMLECVRKYKANNCNAKGELKEHNLNREERQGLKEVKKDIKEKKIVVFTTDKSGKFSVDSPVNYEEAVRQHTTKDVEISENDKVKKIENHVNLHMRQFNKMFKVGANCKQEERVTAATISTNTPAPPMYGLRKDHKEHQDKTVGPPVRPVCGANESPNSRLSGFLSRIINDFADSMDIATECRSSEEMRAAFERYNNEEEEEIKRNSAILSMDVKALYPSMEWNAIGVAVREIVEDSEKEVQDVEWKEVGKYLAVNMKKEEIEREGLQHVIPKRKQETNRKISIAYLSNKKNEGNWSNPRTPGHRQKKKMIGLALAIGVQTCMENHVYKVGDKVFLQQGGGPIGLELTGAVSRVFMWRWDRMYLERAKEAGIKMSLYERYVDDSNQVAEIPEKGARYDKERKKVVVDGETGREDEEGDKRLARILVDIANDILPCIQMEADWPTKNADRRLPILDMKVWTDEEGRILYSHYEKPMSRRTVLNAGSAHPGSCKKSVHIQEVLRRMFNCTRRIDWEKETAPCVTDYMQRMREAGYNEKYRKRVLFAAIGIYDKKISDDEKGIRPLFRPKSWKKEERRKEKEYKKKEWATEKGHIAPIFIPATPGGELAKEMRKIADKEAKNGIHFNVLEIGGRTLRSEIQRSNPTATPGCSKIDCLGCKEERGKGGKCHKNNVNYQISCQKCQKVYIGETSKNLYTRTLQHMHNKKEDESFMDRHFQEDHGGEDRQFTAKVTHTNRDCLTRQIREGVLIRRTQKPLLNSRTEWFQPPLFRIQSEVVRE